MTDPITPPPELVQQWLKERTLLESQPLAHTYLATLAAQYGADQELEACLANIHTMYGKDKADWLRAMRRPKPPSLKEQALEAAIRLGKKYPSYEGSDIETIRRALEALPND